MEGEESQNRKQPDEGSGDQEGENAARISAMSDEDDDDDVEKLQIEEEMVVEVMKQLEEEISSPSPLFNQNARSVVSINGRNEDSCGSSFSDSASTVMASVDTHAFVGVSYFVGGPTDPAPAAVIWPWAVGSTGPEPAGEVVATWGNEKEEGDEWLACVLGGPVFELEESFLSC